MVTFSGNHFLKSLPGWGEHLRYCPRQENTDIAHECAPSDKCKAEHEAKASLELVIGF